VLDLLVERFALQPVAASTLGFAASVVVSYLLQACWVFDTGRPFRTTFPRFVAVVLIGLALNGSIMWVGTEALTQHYLVPQLVALVLVPLSNYTLNSLWTFRGGGETCGLEGRMRHRG
jgi:putative flippase GtrA